MIQIDPVAGGKALFDVTYADTLPLLPTWDHQPQAFKNDLQRKAVAVACAALGDQGLDPGPSPTWDDDPDPVDVRVDTDADLEDYGEPEGGD